MDYSLNIFQKYLSCVLVLRTRRALFLLSKENRKPQSVNLKTPKLFFCYYRPSCQNMFLEFHQLPVSPAVTSCPYLWVILLSEGHYRHISGDRLLSLAWRKWFRARAKVVSRLSHHRFFFQAFCDFFLTHIYFHSEKLSSLLSLLSSNLNRLSRV